MCCHCSNQRSLNAIFQEGVWFNIASTFDLSKCRTKILGRKVLQHYQYYLSPLTDTCFVVFRAKVLESHAERLHGSETETSGERESDSSTELSPPQQAAVIADSDRVKDYDGISIHEQHEKFIEKQVKLASRYKEKQEQLPRTISSKRATSNEEHFTSNKRAKLSRADSVEKVGEQGAGPQKGPRTVSKAEKNKRRKLKKKRRLAHKS